MNIYINSPICLAKDAYAFLSDSSRVSSFAKSTYQKLKLDMQSMREVAAKNKKTLLTGALLTATVAGVYLYGSDLVSYMEKTCSAPREPAPSPAPAPQAKAPSAPAPTHSSNPPPAPREPAPSPVPPAAKPTRTPTFPAKPSSPSRSILNQTQTPQDPCYMLSEQDLPMNQTGTSVADSPEQLSEQFGPSEEAALIPSSDGKEQNGGIWENFSNSLSHFYKFFSEDYKPFKTMPENFGCKRIRIYSRQTKRASHPDKGGNEPLLLIVTNVVEFISSILPHCKIKVSL